MKNNAIVANNLKQAVKDLFQEEIHQFDFIEKFGIEGFEFEPNNLDTVKQRLTIKVEGSKRQYSHEALRHIAILKFMSDNLDTLFIYDENDKDTVSEKVQELKNLITETNNDLLSEFQTAISYGETSLGKGKRRKKNLNLIEEVFGADVKEKIKKLNNSSKEIYKEKQDAIKEQAEIDKKKSDEKLAESTYYFNLAYNSFSLLVDGISYTWENKYKILAGTAILAGLAYDYKNGFKHSTAAAKFVWNKSPDVVTSFCSQIAEKVSNSIPNFR